MAAPNEAKSVSLIIKQRQQSRSSTVAPRPGGKAGGGPGGILNQSLTPVLPPLYPPAPKPSTLIPEVADTVKVYNKLCQYFRSNFSIEHVIREKTGFYYERYTDQYRSPLALDDYLLHILPDSKFPEELGTKSVPRKTVARRQKRKIEDLPDTDEAAPDKNAVPIIKQEPVSEDEDEDKEDANIEDEEFEDDVDEEMDVGTDYAMSYFDNGEGDDDDRDDDEGPTY